MRDFIGNPNKDEFYEEDDVESEVYYDGADNFIYLDPNEMGIEIDDDDDEVYVEDDEDFESFSLGDTSDDDEEYVDDEENLNEEVQDLTADAGNDQEAYHNKTSMETNETDSDYTQSSSDDGCTVIGESSGDSSSS